MTAEHMRAATGQQAKRRAILYIRVSSDEQADGHSLNDQMQLLDRYCRSRGIEVVARYQDDYSAKTRDALGESFERPGFMQMLKWIKANRGAADLLLFKDWSRFSRDATDALVMIRHLRVTLGIEPQAIEQPIDFDVPEQRPLLMLYVGMPEGENLRRGLNIRRGLRQAVREGRWITRPLFGYKRARDERGKACLDPDEASADLVREAFELVSTGYSIEATRKEIRLKAKARGVPFFNSRESFYEMIRNRAYIGEVFLKAWKDEPAEWGAGQHEPIVDRRLFERVQYLIGEREGGEKQIYRDELPLRGHLLDPETGDQLTGSASRSRTGARYWYYHTQPNRAADAQKKVFRVRADVAHDAFSLYLSEVQIAPEVADAFGIVFEDALSDHGRRAAQDRSRLEKRRREIEAKMFKADEAYVDGKIAGDSYNRLKTSYANELAAIDAGLAEITLVDVRFGEHLRFGLELLSNLNRAWKVMPVKGKHDLVGSIFPLGLIFDGESYRTTPRSDLLWLLSGKNVGGYPEQKTGHPSLEMVECPVRWS